MPSVCVQITPPVLSVVILLVSEMERSVKFYRDVLNLPIKSQSDDWTEFFGSGTVIALHPAKRKTKISTGISVLVGFMLITLILLLMGISKRM